MTPHEIADAVAAATFGAAFDATRAAGGAALARYAINRDAVQIDGLYIAVDDVTHVVAHLTFAAISDSAREGQKEEA